MSANQKESAQAPNFLPMGAPGTLGCPVRGVGGEGILFLKKWGTAVSRAVGEGLLEAAEGTGCSMECHSAWRIQCYVRLQEQAGPGSLPITFPHFELGLILTSDDKDPNNGNLFGKG